MADSRFPIAETDDYVRKILSRAGTLPAGDPDALVAHLVPHVIHQESRGNPKAVSPKGAVGRMQTMPATLRDPGFGVKPAADDSDAERERVGRDYLSAMVKRYPGRPDLALAAYNAGPGRADKWAKLGGAAVYAPSATSGSTSPAPAATEPVFRASAGIEWTSSQAQEWGDLPTSEDTPDGSRFLQNVIGRDSAIAGIHRLWQDAGAEFDPNFDLGQLSEKEWKEVTYGIPEEHWEGLASAGSRSHLGLLATRIRAAVQAEQELAGYGGWGVAGRVAVGFADPVALSIGVATGGIGVGTQAARLARAAQMARAAGKFDEASVAVKALEGIAKGSKWRGAGSAFALAGAENAALEAVIGAGDTTRNGWDVAIAGITGGVLGAGASRVFTGLELKRIQTAYVQERSLLEVAELNHRIDVQKADITARMAALDNDVDLADARAALADLNRQLRETAEGRRTALSQQASGALKRSEFGALRRQTEGLRKQARDAENLESQVEARMLQEDIQIHGEEVATSKQYTKLRKAAAKKEAAARKDTITANLQRAETNLGRASAAQDALTELRRVERRAAQGDHLGMLDEPGRNRFGESELAAVQRVKAAEDAVAARKADLEGRLKGLDDARAAGVRASDDALSREAEAFGQDTASAARFMGFDEGVHPHLEGKADESGLPEVGKMALAKAARVGPMATITGILRGSDNAVVRKLLGPLVGNSVGNKDGSANIVGASEIHSRIHETMTAKFYSAMEPAYKDWAERNGVGMIERKTRPARDRFMGEVGLHVRGQASEDPAVIKAAGKVRSIFAEYLTQAKEAGVKGFEEVELNERYLPRVFDFKRAFDIEQDIGSDNFRLLVQRAVQAANEDVDDALAAKLAKVYVKRMKELRVGSDASLMQGVRWDDVGFLRRFLTEAELGSEEVEDIVGKFAAINLQRQRQTEGSFRSAKRRAQFDENYSMRFRSQNASKAGRIEDVEVRMSDLFENNVEALFGRYSRSVSGHIGLAKVGIRSKADFDSRIEMVERELSGDLDELKRVKDTAEMAYKVITGQPVQDATALTRWGRAARDYNFATTMNQAGWAQFPDLAGLVGKGYLGYTFREFFGGSAFKLFRRTDGSLDDTFAREMEEWLGVGTDFHNNAVFSSFDPGEEGGLKGAFGTTEHGLRVAGRGTQVISGMAFITSFAQRMVARSIVQRLTKEALEGGAFSKGRAAQLGLDEAMTKRIGEQLKAHTEFVDGDFGGRVKVVNWSKWDDVDARDAMLYAAFREARRLVQEEDLGDTTKWMHQNWGKLLAQFRRFALVSYSKQLLHGIAHADAEEATRLALSMTMAAMAYTARHEVALGLKEAGGASEEELQEYREKFLTPDRLAAAAFANSSYSSLTPMLYDSTVGMLTGERVFDTRTSGLGSDLVTGNPTISAVKNLGRAVGGVSTAILRGDQQFDQGDARAIRKLFPYQNALGVEGLYTALTADLPEEDADPDPTRVDWFLQD